MNGKVAEYEFLGEPSKSVWKENTGKMNFFSCARDVIKAQPKKLPKNAKDLQIAVSKALGEEVQVITALETSLDLDRGTDFLILAKNGRPGSYYYVTGDFTLNPAKVGNQFENGPKDNHVVVFWSNDLSDKEKARGLATYAEYISNIFKRRYAKVLHTAPHPKNNNGKYQPRRY